MEGQYIYEVTKTLTGPVEAVGESNEDQRRYENLETMIEVVDKLIGDIRIAAEDRFRQEASMKNIGEKAYSFLNELTKLED